MSHSLLNTIEENVESKISTLKVEEQSDMSLSHLNLKLIIYMISHTHDYFIIKKIL